MESFTIDNNKNEDLPPQLTDEETKLLLAELSRAKKEQNQKEILIIRKKLIEENMRLVNYILYQNLPQNINEYDKEEIYQIAYSILIDFIDEYDPKKRYPLSTKLNNFLIEKLRKKYHDLDLVFSPSYIKTKLNQVIQTKEELEAKLKRSIKPQELADALNVHVIVIEELLNLYYLQNIESLDDLYHKEENKNIFIGASSTGLPEVEIDNLIKKEIIEETLSTLTEREALAIKLRFGLYDGTEYTFEQCASIMGIPIYIVREMIVKALRKLRHPIRRRLLMEIEVVSSTPKYQYVKKQRLSK